MRSTVLHDVDGGVLVCTCHVCTEYYREHIERRVTQSTVVTRHSVDSRALSTGHRVPPSRHYQLINQPLFWTSVVSMLLAVVCTVAIVVLCLTSSRRSRRRRACAAWSRDPSAAPPDVEHKNLHRDDSLSDISRE